MRQRQELHFSKESNVAGSMQMLGVPGNKSLGTLWPRAREAERERETGRIGDRH